VRDEYDQLIQGALWANKPAGMEPYGLYTPGLGFVDELGITRVMPFTRAAQVRIYIVVTPAVSASMPTAQRATLQTTIVQALVAASQGQPFTLYGTKFTPDVGAATTLVPGEDVVLSALKSIVQGQSGVIDVPVFTMGLAPAPAGTANIPIAIGQVATLSNVDITVNAPVTFVP
jgi:hypothetical protein